MSTILARLVSTSDEETVIALEGRVSADNAAELGDIINSLRTQSPQGLLTLDADALDYISSAGLRVIMRLLKSEGDLAIVNTSNAVYDVFEMTGLTQLMTVRRRLREISLEGATKLGQGGNGEVWRLDAETVIKVYNAGTSLGKIDAENRQATAAFTAGIPCAIAFDTVKVGDRYGIVFELLDAQTVGNAVHEDHSRIPELGRKMGELLREMHSTRTAPGILPAIDDKMSAWVDYLESHYLSHEDAELMRQVLAAVPHKDTLLHLDFHEGNVMLQGDELVLIDLDDICTGNPLFDLINHHSSHIVAAESAPEVIKISLGMNVDEALAMHRVMLKTYLGTDDDAVVDAHVQTMRLIMLFNMLMFLAKSRDSKNMTPDRAQMVLDGVLPQFRAMQPQIVQVVSSWK